MLNRLFPAGSISDHATLLSAALGILGTVVLFFSSYALQPLDGGFFGSESLYKWNAHITAKNQRRKIIQRIGLVLLCLSFAVQFVAVLWPGLINILWCV